MTNSLFTSSQQGKLLTLARASIQHGLEKGSPLKVKLEDFDPGLTAPGAAFVTLEKRGELRGCIGSFEAYRSLVEDVAEHAWSAAFEDPRFQPLTSRELERLEIKISVLTPPESLEVTSLKDLKQQLEPGHTGLIIRDGHHRSLFLPAVWNKLPEVDDFLDHLFQKAGLPQAYWSTTLFCQTFYSFEFSDKEL